MRIRELNQQLFELPTSHPARRFLDSFIQCRAQCVGKELESPSVDQEWVSTHDGAIWHFSKFAYVFLSFDIELDGWLTNAPIRTTSEQQMLNGLGTMRHLLSECKSAAEQENSRKIVDLVVQVEEVVDLWEKCILVRTPG